MTTFLLSSLNVFKPHMEILLRLILQRLKGLKLRRSDVSIFPKSSAPAFNMR